MEAASEDKEKLEPEKEKNPQVQDEEANPDYCSMEAIAERWRDKPRKKEVTSTNPKSRMRPVSNQWPPPPEPGARKTPRCY